jgi:hypothetical protein
MGGRLRKRLRRRPSKSLRKSTVRKPPGKCAAAFSARR